MRILLGLGVGQNSAMKGLYYTGNCSAEYAANFIFDHPELEDDLDFDLRVEIEEPKDEPEEVEDTLDSDEDTGDGDRYKMVFIVDTSLEMSTGKIAAEVARASVGLYRHLKNSGKTLSEQVTIWEEDGERMFVVAGDDESHLLQLDKLAVSIDLETYIVHDAEVAEAAQDTVTVVAIFGRDEAVDSITGKLPPL